MRSLGRGTPARETATVRIRAARPDDAHGVVSLAAELSRHEGRPPPHFDVSDFERDGFGTDAAFSVIVAELTGSERGLAGYTLFYPGYDVESATRGMHMADLYVRPPHRRRGIASGLMAELARHVRQSGGRWVTWLAHRGNQDALAFYDRIGANRPAAVSFDMGPQALERLIRRVGRRGG